MNGKNIITFDTSMTAQILARPKIALFADHAWMHTRSTLAAVMTLRLSGEVSRVLIVTEKSRFDDWTKAFTDQVSLVVSVDGPPERRLRRLSEPASGAYAISRTLLTWLIETEHEFDFDMIVVDGVPGRKSASWSALAALCERASRVVILDDIPSLEALWERVYLLDSGKRLGRTMEDFHEEHFLPWTCHSGVVWDWKPMRGADRWISSKIRDVCLRVPVREGVGV